MSVFSAPVDMILVGCDFPAIISCVAVSRTKYILYVDNLLQHVCDVLFDSAVSHDGCHTNRKEIMRSRR